MTALSKAQRVVLLIGMILIALSFLFPCWRCFSGENRRLLDQVDYHFVFLPPASTKYTPPMSIDLTRLAIQEVTIIILTVGAILLLAPRRKSEAKNSNGGDK